MKLLSSLEFQIIVIVVAFILLLFQSSEAISSSSSQKDAKDGKNTVSCTSDSCLYPVGYPLRLEFDTGISEGVCTSNISRQNWNVIRHGKTLQISTVSNNGTAGFRFECNGSKHWLIKDNVTLSDSGKYTGAENAQKSHAFEVQVVDVKLKWHSSDDETQVLVTMNYSDIATSSTNITNSSCWYYQTNSTQQFTAERYWKAFIVNLKDKTFDRPQLCCQFSVSKGNSEKTFSIIPNTALQIGQCNQTTVTITPELSVTPTPPGHSSSSIVSSSEKIKSSTFPVVVLLFVAFSFHQRYLINYRP